jgi:serine/threonine protein kinase
MVSGLKYLHDKWNLVHGNLKPSNVLVKPPLTKPEGFVLTDYKYTDHRGYPQEIFCCCIPPKDSSDEPEITKWMAPELLEGPSDEVWTNRLSSNDSDCSILDLNETQHASNSGYTTFQSSPMADVFSLGKILQSMFEKCSLLDKVDKVLCKLLVEQTIRANPTERISCDDILKKHPFLVVQPVKSGDIKSTADARIDHIKELYDKVKEKGNLRQQIERDLYPVTAKFFPWSEPSLSFGGIIYCEMNKRPQIKRKYDGGSFMDLLRLIRNTKEHPLEEKKLKHIKDEVDKDAFSKNFPFVLPLIYVWVECTETSRHLIRFLSDLII